MTARAATAVALALALAAPARGDEPGEVRGDAALRLRLVGQANLPSSQILFDPAAAAFDVAGYLGPARREGYAAGIVAAGLDGSHLDGRLAWALSLDSGLVRARRFPETVAVCTSSGPTGLELLGSAGCLAPGTGLRRVFLVPSTQLGPRELTANGRPVEDEARDTVFVREAWVEARLGRARFLSVRAGRQRVVVGDGLVHDDYALGLAADADLGALGPQLDLSLAAFWPTRGRVEEGQLRSSMLAFRADWTPSLFERVGVFAAFGHDETGAASGLLLDASAEALAMRLRDTAPGTDAYRRAAWALGGLLGAAPRGSHDLFWVGLQGHVFLGRHELSWSGAALFGRATVPVPVSLTPPAVELQSIPVEGQAARLRWRLPVTPELSAGAFLLFQSGDLPPAERFLLGQPRRYDGFLAATPYLTDLNLFFNGGISESFASRRATAPGVNGRGVIAPGLSLDWDPSAELSLDGRGAWLLADEAGPYGGRVYGVEVDLNASWSPWPWLTLLGEADVLFPGGFFPFGAPVHRVILGVNLSTP